MGRHLSQRGTAVTKAMVIVLLSLNFVAAVDESVQIRLNAQSPCICHTAAGKRRGEKEVPGKEAGNCNAEMRKLCFNDEKRILEILDLCDRIVHVFRSNALTSSEELFAVANETGTDLRLHCKLGLGRIVKLKRKRVLGGGFSVRQHIQRQNLHTRHVLVAREGSYLSMYMRSICEPL